MKFWNVFTAPNINDGIRKMQSIPGAVLLDVRTPEEYRDAHIPGSLNIPPDELQTVLTRIHDKHTPLFVHCLSGGRSRQAVFVLKQFGYTDVTDLGGIRQYNGIIEKGAYK